MERTILIAVARADLILCRAWRALTVIAPWAVVLGIIAITKAVYEHEKRHV